MTFKFLINEITSLLNDMINELNYPNVDFSVDEPPRSDLCDVYSNIAFQLSRKLKKKPFDIAREIYEKIIKSYLQTKKDSMISSVLC